MMKIFKKSYAVCAASLLAALVVTTLTQAGEPDQARQQHPLTDYTDRLIVKLRGQPVAAQDATSSGAVRLQALSARAGMTLAHVRPMSWGAQVLQLPGRMTLADADTIAQKLRADPDVEYAEPDRIMHPLAVPNDTLFSSQWHYLSPPIEPGGVNLPPAWDITTGQPNITIALVDTGILPHTDLAGRTVPGYDFIGHIPTANDGNGRDADPTDPGDWVTAAESDNTSGPFAGCGVSNSSWHGTHIAGTIGAATNNGQGVAGINWVSKILPVRVLGKCGGYLSDVIDGERWAAGLSVTGVPRNANPAKVLNQSLGSSGRCTTAQQRAIDEIVALGKVIVVAAGNENTDVANANPANCKGVITVAATNRAGGKTSYTNYGALVDISAPGGQQAVPNESNGILSTLNTGTTTALADDYRYLSGTSFATSHVTGIVALMLSVNPALTPAQVLTAIQVTARAFPSGSSCTTALCGAGIIDAAAAVNQARTLDEPKPKGGGGGCTIALAAGQDPVLPLSVIIAALYLLRRRYSRKS
ncbi:MAG: S8 family peptidase [Gammaproteobacteria bacterium]